MRSLVGLISISLVACTVNNGKPVGGGSGSGSGSGSGTAICNVVNECVCPSDRQCAYDCVADEPECHVQGAPHEPVSVTCDDDGDCHVECSQATNCAVDCGNSPDCHVTCPEVGCQVTGCDPAAGCVVSCGLAGPASMSGTTATCP